MGPIPSTTPLPVAMFIPGGVNPERTLFIDGYVMENAQWFCFSLQSGPSLQGEDDVMFFYMVHIRDDITTFTQNSYVNGKWYDVTEYQKLCKKVERALEAAKKSNEEKSDAIQSEADADKLEGSNDPPRDATKRIEIGPSTSKLTNHSSMTVDDVESLKNLLKTLRSFHYDKKTDSDEQIQTKQSFDEAISMGIASYTYTSNDTIFSAHEVKPMETSTTLVKETDSERNLRKQQDKSQTSMRGRCDAHILREIIKKYIEKQTSKEQINNESTYRNTKKIPNDVVVGKQNLSGETAAESAPARASAKDSNPRTNTSTADNVPVSSDPKTTPGPRTVHKKENPVKLFEKIVQSNKRKQQYQLQSTQNTNERQESEDPRSLEAREKDRETRKKYRNMNLTNIQTFTALSTGKQVRNKEGSTDGVRRRSSIPEKNSYSWMKQQSKAILVDADDHVVEPAADKDDLVTEHQLEAPFTDDELHELDLRPGDIFQFALECLEHGYMVTLNEELVCVYPRLAHFAHVSHLAVAGDVGLQVVEVDGGRGPARHLLMELEEDFEWTAVVSLNEQNFARLVLGGGGMWVVCAYAAWCPACHAFAPRLEAAAEELAGHKIMVGAIDGDRNEQLMDDLQIPHYPSIVCFPKGRKSLKDRLVYNGDRNCVVEWALYVLSGGIHMPITVRVRDQPKTARKPLAPLRRRGYRPGGTGYDAMRDALAAALNSDEADEEEEEGGAWHHARCEETSPRLVSAELVHGARTVVRSSVCAVRVSRSQYQYTSYNSHRTRNNLYMHGGGYL